MSGGNLRRCFLMWLVWAAGCLTDVTTGQAQTRVTLVEPHTNARATATVDRDFLKIDQPGGVEFYNRDRSYDAPGYWGYSNPSLPQNQIVRWPADHLGAIEVGTISYGMLSFRPARMRIVRPSPPWSGGTIPAPSPRVYLGVNLTPHPSGGGTVQEVAPRSLADEMGIQVGDHLVRVNDSPFGNSREFQQALSRSFTEVKVDLIRRGRRLTVQLQLVGRPVPWRPMDNQPPPRQLGIVGDVDPVQGGIVVRLVTPGSAAELMGIRPGDRIVQVNGTAVRSSDDLQRALARTGNRLYVNLMRYGRGLTLSL